MLCVAFILAVMCWGFWDIGLFPIWVPILSTIYAAIGLFLNVVGLEKDSHKDN